MARIARPLATVLAIAPVVPQKETNPPEEAKKVAISLLPTLVAALPNEIQEKERPRRRSQRPAGLETG